MNREPPLSAPDEDEPPPEIRGERSSISRAEMLGWCAWGFGFAAVAWVLLFPALRVETRLVLSLLCLLIGGAFFLAAYRQLD